MMAVSELHNDYIGSCVISCYVNILLRLKISASANQRFDQVLPNIDFRVTNGPYLYCTHKFQSLSNI